MRSEVQTEIEAVLLNSQGDPANEVMSAFCAVIRFVRSEMDASDDQIRTALEVALLLQEAKGEP